MTKPVIGWIGMGRMGYPMAERVVKAGYEVRIWNRTRAKAEPLEAKGATLVDSPRDLAGVDVLITMVSTGKDVETVLFGPDGVLTGASVPGIFVDSSSISSDQSAKIREKLAARGAEFVAAPVSGNGKCVKAGKLSSVCSGPRKVFEKVEPIVAAYAAAGVSYVGEGELARFCKIAHNVFLGVVIQNLAEITILAQKAGVPRHAFLDFMNNSAPRSVGGARPWRADAGDGRHARGAPGAFRGGDAEGRPRGLSPDGFLGADRDGRAGRGAEAPVRERAVSDGARSAACGGMRPRTRGARRDRHEGTVT